MKFVPTLAVLAALAGCVPYPVYKTFQPAAIVTIVDSKAHPIEGAMVTMIASARPSYPAEKSRETKTSDAQGRVEFASKRQWRTEVLMLHGSEQYAWNWCVQKTGFVTYESAYDPLFDRLIDTFKPAATIVLHDGASTGCSKELT